jgi:hypothetical protein
MAFMSPKLDPLDYAGPESVNKPNPPWRRIVFAAAATIFAVITLGLVVVVIAGMNSEWPLPQFLLLLLPAGFFGLMAVFALIESVRRTRKNGNKGIP